MKYRLGLDLGSTSLGWCLLKVNDNGDALGIQDMGVRIFSDGRDAKSKEPLAVTRRNARGARRRLDRRKLRVERLVNYLVEIGFFPKDIEERKALKDLDPYALRARALDEQVSKAELGRLLVSIARRRGFKSNRKSDSQSDEKGAIKQGIKSLHEALEHTGSRTLGEYLSKQSEKLARPISVGSKNSYTIYPARDMYEDELKQIFAKQKAYYGDLTEDVIGTLTHIILMQRPLKPQEIGLCTLEYEAKEKRAPKAHPLVQRFRILQEVNNLEIDQFKAEGQILSKDDRQKIIQKLETSKTVTFKGIRKLLKLANDIKFNLEGEKRDSLNGNTTSYALSKEQCFGSEWYNMPQEEQSYIVDCWLNDEDEEGFKKDLLQRYALSEDQVDAISNADLPDDYSNLSLKAIRKILPYLEEGYKYHEACQKAGYHHSDDRTGEIFNKGDLPYYGQVLQRHVIGGSFSPEDEANPEKFYGKINNPTVHIALNQVRQLVNAITKKYGDIEACHIELARELPKGTKDRREIERSQGQNKKENDRIIKELKEDGIEGKYKDRMKVKLWEDLAKDPKARYCPFCPASRRKVISLTDLFSSAYEIEHLVPFSRSFNDGRNNKVIACKACNREKGNKTPYEAFGHNAERWDAILDAVQFMPPAKQKYFTAEAGREAEDDFIARQLTDTQYTSRLARKYLEFVCGSNKVVSVRGALTALVRHHWGLNDIVGEGNKKDRTLHYHHAIDAFTIACVTRSLIQHISKQARIMVEDEGKREKRYKLIEHINSPYDTYHNEIKDMIKYMIISQRPDHGSVGNASTVGQLHEETAYGFISPSHKRGVGVFAVRKSISSLEKIKDIESIADDHIRRTLLYKLEGYEGGGFKERLQELCKPAREGGEFTNGLRHVRMHEEKVMDNMVAIQSGGSDPYKYYLSGNNYCADIYVSQFGKKAGEWQGEVISNYNAHQKGFVPKWRKNDSTAKKIMRLYKRDMIAIDGDNGDTQVYYVQKMSSDGRVYFQLHHVAKEGDNYKLAYISVSQMMKKNARKLHVDILGHVWDSKGQIKRTIKDRIKASKKILD